MENKVFIELQIFQQDLKRLSSLSDLQTFLTSQSLSFNKLDFLLNSSQIANFAKLPSFLSTLKPTLLTAFTALSFQDQFSLAHSLVTESVHKEVPALRTIIGELCTIVVSNDQHWPMTLLIKSEDMLSMIFGFMTRVTNYMEGVYSKEFVPEKYYQRVISKMVQEYGDGVKSRGIGQEFINKVALNNLIDVLVKLEIDLCSINHLISDIISSIHR